MCTWYVGTTRVSRLFHVTTLYIITYILYIHNIHICITKIPRAYSGIHKYIYMRAVRTRPILVLDTPLHTYNLYVYIYIYILPMCIYIHYYDVRGVQNIIYYALDRCRCRRRRSSYTYNTNTCNEYSYCTLRRSFPIPSGTVACVMIYRK